MFIFISVLFFSCSFISKTETKKSSSVTETGTIPKINPESGTISKVKPESLIDNNPTTQTVKNIVPITSSTITIENLPPNSNVYLVDTNPNSNNLSKDQIKYITNAQRVVMIPNNENTISSNESDSLNLSTTNSNYGEDSKFITNYNKQVLNFIRKTSKNARNVSIDHNTSSDPKPSVGDTREFNVFGKNKAWEKRMATLRSVNKYCLVWVADENFTESKEDNKITLSQAQVLGEKFDSAYPFVTKIFGEKFDGIADSPLIIEKRDTISILIYDVFNDFSTSQNGGTFGYFNSLDFLKTTATTSFSDADKSNEDELIYIDANFYNASKNQMYSTLVHELQHMLNCAHKDLKDFSVESETWYTEMLSTVCEDIMQEKLQISDRESSKTYIKYFNKSYYKTGLIEWLSGDDVYNSYAMAYVFGAYLARNYGGVELIKEIAFNKSANEKSITEALQALGYNETFESVFKSFGQACINARLGDTTGLTFNKTVTSTIDDTQFTFFALDLTSNVYKNTFTSNGESKTIKGPVYFYTNVESLQPIKPWGFVLYSVGTYSGTQTFNIGNYEGSQDYAYLYIK